MTFSRVSEQQTFIHSQHFCLPYQISVLLLQRASRIKTVVCQFDFWTVFQCKQKRPRWVRVLFTRDSILHGALISLVQMIKVTCCCDVVLSCPEEGFITNASAVILVKQLTVFNAYQCRMRTCLVSFVGIHHLDNWPRHLRVTLLVMRKQREEMQSVLGCHRAFFESSSWSDFVVFWSVSSLSHLLLSWFFSQRRPTLLCI